MKKVLSIICFLLVAYFIFVIVDCLRLNYANEFTKPIAIVDSVSSEDQIVFTGVGYKVIYKIERVRQSSDLEYINAKEAKFILFDTFTLWTKNYDTK